MSAPDGEPDVNLDGLKDLDLVRVFLERVAEDIPRPSPALGEAENHYSLLAARAAGLYANFHHSLTSPADFAPILALRPLVELAILIKWLSLDPEFHGFLWFADSEASELTHLTAMLAHAKVRGSSPPAVDTSDMAPKEAIRDDAKRQLAAKGVNYGKNQVAPSVIRMVEEVEKAIPAHKNAMRDSYEFAYRTFSPWEHTEASSFKATAERVPPDTWAWLGDRQPFHLEEIQAIAASMYAYILEVALLGLGLDGAAVARQVRDFVTVEWVRSDRVRAAAELPGDAPTGTE